MEMHAEDHMVDAFIVAGADPHFAKMHVKAMLQVEPQKPTTFMDIYMEEEPFAKRRTVQGGV